MASPLHNAGGSNGQQEVEPATPAPSRLDFLVDENLPRQLVQRLRADGYAVEHVTGVGLRGRPDADVYSFAQAQGATLITADGGFGNLLEYPPPHAGIVIVRVPDTLAIAHRIEVIATGLAGLAGQPRQDALITIEAGRVRVRR
jgi:predicted nuclease of predicted toxin-antitoxin system